MKQPYVTFLMLLILVSCKPPLKSSTFNVNYKGNDTCIFFTNVGGQKLSVKRELEVLENTINDTILLGMNLIPSRYTGKIMYLQIDKRKDVMMYRETDSDAMPGTSMLCIQPYKKGVKGMLKIKYKFE